MKVFFCFVFSAGTLVEDMFIHALTAERGYKKYPIWLEYFTVFLTPKVTWAFIKWDDVLLRLVELKCSVSSSLVLEIMYCLA